MNEQLVAGLDLDVAHIGVKGARTTQAYLAFGRLSSKGLEIYHLKQEPFGNLAKELGTAKYSGAGLNFPFSMPAEFIEFCAQKATRAGFQSWQEYVEHLFSVDLQQFAVLAKEFKREPLRSTDSQHGFVGVGPLHKEDPPMVELTYSGVRNLAGLDPQKFCILPFHDAHEGLCSVMEVSSQGTMTVLKLLGKSAAGNGDQRESRREVIGKLLAMKAASPLSFKDHPDLFVSPEVQSACEESAHALSAVMACYTTALWVNAPSLFEDPYESGDEKVLLEGWAYLPRSA